MAGLSQFTEDEWARLRRGAVSHHSAELLAAEGLYRGGEQLIEDVLPNNWILPIPLEEVLQAGVRALGTRRVRLLSAAEVANRIRKAALNRRGFSLIRLGDGELLTLAQNTVRSIEEVALAGDFLGYAGVQVPDLRARDELALSVVQSDIVGIPKSRRQTFQVLFSELVRYYGWPVSQWCLASSIINYELDMDTHIYSELLGTHRVLLVGNRMQELSKLLAASGRTSIVGVVPVAGVSAVSLVLEELKQYEFDVALVSAGVAAELICAYIKSLWKVALDFGHLADHLLQEGRPL